MYEVLDICRYIINYCYENLNGISNLKLQKILYFIQIQFLKEYNEVCFSDNIEAWNFGPVILKAYNEYSRFGALTIPASYNYLEYTPEILWDVERKIFNKNIIKKKHRKTIELVLNVFENYSNAELTELILHQEPYINAYNNNTIITIDSLKKYFNIKEKKWILNIWKKKKKN